MNIWFRPMAIKNNNPPNTQVSHPFSSGQPKSHGRAWVPCRKGTCEGTRRVSPCRDRTCDQKTGGQLAIHVPGTAAIGDHACGCWEKSAGQAQEQALGRTQGLRCKKCQVRCKKCPHRGWRRLDAGGHFLSCTVLSFPLTTEGDSHRRRC